MRKLCYLLCVVLLCLTNLVGASNAKPLVAIDLYSINDFHGWLRADAEHFGAAGLSATLQMMMEDNPQGSLLLGGGDMTAGTLDANAHDGLPVILAMNKMGFAANAVGNHCFDYNQEIINKQVALADFPFLTANILDERTGKIATPFKPYLIVERKGVKIALIGLTTSETSFKAHQDKIKNLQIVAPELVAQRYIDEVRAQGAEIVILLTHISSAQGKGNTITGEITQVLDQVTGVDAVITGHSHNVVNGLYNDIPVVQAGKYGQAIGKINLLYSRAERRVISAGSRVFILKDFPRSTDKSMEKLLNETFQATDAKYGLQLAENKIKLTNNRLGQSTVAEYFMDLLKQGFKADVALYNGGAVRADLSAGKVTLREITNIFSFNNTLYLTDLSGKDILAALEHGVGNTDISLIRFSGLRVQADITKPRGQKILSAVLADGSPLAPNKYYKVITNDFMIAGGDGYKSLMQGKNNRSVGTDQNFFIYALRKVGTINYRQSDNRLQY